MIQLEALYSHLQPADNNMLDERKNTDAVHLARIKKLSLVSISKDSKDSETTIVNQAPAVLLSESAEFDFPNDSDSHNQKYQLLSALLELSHWNVAEKLLKYLRATQPASDPSVSKSLCRFVERLIQPQTDFINNKEHYNCLSKSRSNSAVAKVIPSDWWTSPDWSPSTISKLLSPLSYLTVYFHRHVVTFSRLCRFTRHALVARIKQWTQQQKQLGKVPSLQVLEYELPNDLETLICNVLLSAYSLIPSSTSIANEIWYVLNELPYTVRYKLYGCWNTIVYSSCSELQLQQATTLQRVKYFSKRIAAERVKQCA